MGSRRHSREIALQLLYQMEMTESAPRVALDLYYANFEASPDARPFAERLVEGVVLHREEIDQLIASASEHWRLERMSIIDRNILRLALFEMLHCSDIPLKVSINEAVELGKSFGSPESGAFVNGILDQLLSRIDRR
jgi:transcription antitermination protein NusB